jgi:hypothetical protein
MDPLINTNERVWILGAPDPEMEAIEQILREVGERVAYMQTYSPGKGGWVRVDSGNAYGPNVIALGVESLCPRTVYLVECGISQSTLECAYVTIDHHRPGDPGYGRLSSEFLPASSLGQVIAELARLGRLPRPIGTPQDGVSSSIYDDAITGFYAYRIWEREGLHPGKGGEWLLKGSEWKIAENALDSPSRVRAVRIPQKILMTAASDHCLAAAYQGHCPGVDPKNLAKWRAESRAAFQGRLVEDVLKDIERAKKRLARAPLLSLGEESVCDMRQKTCPELPEAATQLGISYIAGPLPDQAGQKIVCSGTPGQIESFFEWAKNHGLTRSYGDPARGFGGAYLP